MMEFEANGASGLIACGYKLLKRSSSGDVEQGLRAWRGWSAQHEISKLNVRGGWWREEGWRCCSHLYSTLPIDSIPSALLVGEFCGYTLQSNAIWRCFVISTLKILHRRITSIIYVHNFKTFSILEHLEDKEVKGWSSTFRIINWRQCALHGITPNVQSWK